MGRPYGSDSSTSDSEDELPKVRLPSCSSSRNREKEVQKTRRPYGSGSSSSDSEDEETRPVPVKGKETEKEKPPVTEKAPDPERPPAPVVPVRPEKGTGMMSNLHVSEENRIQKGEHFDELTSAQNLFIQGGDGTQQLVSSFEEAHLPSILMENLKEMNITTPTAIQRATLHLILKKFEFDIVAQAETGSGKTAAYLLPLISLISTLKRTMKTPPMRPFAIVIVPTRELAAQIGAEAKKLVKNLAVTVAVTYGQMDWRMSVRDIKSGCDILIGTPGRLFFHLNPGKQNSASIQLSNHFWTVVDEADDFNRMARTEFDDLMDLLMVQNTGRQKRLYVFSATFTADSVEKFKDYMQSKPFEIFGREGTGTINFAWRHVTAQTKLAQLLQDLHFAKISHAGHFPKTVIFADTKARCKFLSFFLAANGFPALLIFGDCSQGIREDQLRKFASGESRILVCTNLAARGLNMRDIRYVINYDFPSTCIDVFTHRVGRTGRNGNEGSALTYFEEGRDNASAKEIVAIMHKMGKTLPDYIYNYAQMIKPSEHNRSEHQVLNTVSYNPSQVRPSSMLTTVPVNPSQPSSALNTVPCNPPQPSSVLNASRPAAPIDQVEAYIISNLYQSDCESDY